MKRRVRHHVNPLGLPFLGGDARPIPLPASDVAVEVELGCADARFLFDLAPQHMDRFFVGLEIRLPLVKQVNELADARQLSNLRAHFCNVNVDLDRLFPNRRLARVYINFPDPWFKARQKKRRVVTSDLVEVLRRKLATDGELFFQSDVFDLALDAMAVLEASGLRNEDGPWSFSRVSPYAAKSLREVRCEEKGGRIWRMRYREPVQTV